MFGTDAAVMLGCATRARRTIKYDFRPTLASAGSISVREAVRWVTPDSEYVTTGVDAGVEREAPPLSGLDLIRKEVHDWCGDELRRAR